MLFVLFLVACKRSCLLFPVLGMIYSARAHAFIILYYNFYNLIALYSAVIRIFLTIGRELSTLQQLTTATWTIQQCPGVCIHHCYNIIICIIILYDNMRSIYMIYYIILLYTRALHMGIYMTYHLTYTHYTYCIECYMKYIYVMYIPLGRHCRRTRHTYTPFGIDI